MRRLILYISAVFFCNLLFSQTAIDSNWDATVKSVFLSRNDIELERPLIRMNSFGEPSEQLTLRFDILSPVTYSFRYRIRHCNALWEIDDLDDSDFLSGIGEGSIDNYQPSFNTLQQYVNYYQLIPGTFNYFTASGNYIVEVYLANEPEHIILTRRFCVYEDLTSIEAVIAKPSGAYGNIFNDQEISIGITPANGSYLPLQADYYHVVVQQNGREDLTRIMPFNGYNGSTMMYQWKAENVFPGGNNFRYFDLSNMWAAMYHVQRIEKWGGENFAFLQPEEDRSEKAYSQYNSLNGGMKINIRDRNNPQTEADYVWVNFSLPMEYPLLNGNVYIVGELTGWHMNDESRMEWQPQYKAYTKRLLLKQGYYSYQLLFLPAGEHEGLTATFEGDHFVTPNNYTIYVYLRTPGTRYDRMVGLKKIGY